MNINKSEVKISLTKEFGKQFEEKKREAEKEQWALIGETRALKKVAKKVADLMPHVDKDLKEGKLDEILNEPLLVTKYAKKQYQHAIGVIDNLATQSEIAYHRAAGLEIGYRRSAEMVQRMHAEEMEKLEALQRAIEEGKVKLVGGELVFDEDDKPRGVPSGHPGLPMKEKRLQEESEAQDTKKSKVRRKSSASKPPKTKLNLVKEPSGDKTGDSDKKSQSEVASSKMPAEKPEETVN